MHAIGCVRNVRDAWRQVAGDMAAGAAQNASASSAELSAQMREIDAVSGAAEHSMQWNA
jgi:hypothetical protein